MSTKASIVKVLDREGQGHCQECGRENIRWVAVLSDGSTVGSECAKKITGQVFSLAKYSWVSGATEVASKVDCGATWTMWVNGPRAFLALNGALKATGSVANINTQLETI